jgi:hypothetical protein
MKKQSQVWAVEAHRVTGMLRLPHSVDTQLTVGSLIHRPLFIYRKRNSL